MDMLLLVSILILGVWAPAFADMSVMSFLVSKALLYRRHPC
jgi:hypothetical protein